MGIMTNQLHTIDRDDDKLHMNSSKPWPVRDGAAQSPCAMGIKGPQ